MHNNQQHKEINYYTKLTNNEIENFTEMFSVFQDLILAMIRNAVRVLPKDKSKNFTPKLTAHLDINRATKHNQEYEKFMDIKDVFLSCIENKNHKEVFNKAIKCFTVDDKQKVRFLIKKSFYITLEEKSKHYFNEDIKKMEKIINKINDNFNLRLPEAQQQGKLMISKIKRIDIPEKAKYSGKEKSKGKGIS